MATKTLTLYPTLGTFQDRPLIAWISSHRAGYSDWSEIKRWAADLFSADEDEIDTREVFFGGVYSDDDSREVLTIKGEIVGVFDEPLTADEWRLMLAADATQSEPVASFQIAAE